MPSRFWVGGEFLGSLTIKLERDYKIVGILIYLVFVSRALP